MSSNTFVEQLTSQTAKPAPSAEKGFAEALTGKHESAAPEIFAERILGEQPASRSELDFLEIEARIKRLEQRQASMTTQEKLAVVEAVTRKGRRKSKRRRTREASKIDENCSALEKFVQLALEREVKSGWQGKKRASESMQARRRGRPTQARRYVSDLDTPGISLQEAIRRNPRAQSPVDLVGEIHRQHVALASGGEPSLRLYLLERKKLVGF